MKKMDTEEYLMKISERIKEIRTQKGLSLYAFAKKMNTSRTQAIRIESGQNTGIGTLRDVCIALDVKLMDLLSIDE